MSNAYKCIWICVLGIGGCAAARPDVGEVVLQERTTAAQRLVVTIDEQIQAHEALTPTLVDLRFNCQRQVVGAALARAPDREAQLALAKEYVASCLEFKKRLDTGLGDDVTRVQVSQANYFAADSQLLQMIIASGTTTTPPKAFEPSPPELEAAARDRLATAINLLPLIRQKAGPPSTVSGVWVEAAAVHAWLGSRLALCADRTQYSLAIHEGLALLTEISTAPDGHSLHQPLLSYTAADLRCMLATAGPGAAETLDQLVRAYAGSTPAAKQLATSRVEAMGEFIRALRTREEGGEALTPAWMMLKARAHRRAFDARLDIAEDRPQRLAAAEEYLARAKSDLAIVEGLIHQYPINLVIPRYQVADAQYEIARIRSEK